MKDKIFKKKKDAYKSAVRTLKWAWVAFEVKGGWRLKLYIGTTILTPKPNRIFKTMEAVENFSNAFELKKGHLVFIHLKNTKYPRD